MSLCRRSPSGDVSAVGRADWSFTTSRAADHDRLVEVVLSVRDEVEAVSEWLISLRHLRDDPPVSHDSGSPEPMCASAIERLVQTLRRAADHLADVDGFSVGLLDPRAVSRPLRRARFQRVEALTRRAPRVPR